MDRRQFLRLAGGAAALAATGLSCGGSGSDDSDEAVPSNKESSGPGGGERTLRIAQWDHTVPAYDSWFDDFADRWGAEHDVAIFIDHIPLAEVVPRGDTEVAARGPHDIFGFTDPPPAFEDEVIDHRDIIEELEARSGKLAPLVQRSVFNPKTGKYFGAPHYWVPRAVHYRADMWAEVEPGRSPSTWDDLRRAGPALKAKGLPLGLGMSPYGDSNWAMLSLLYAHGVSIQDEQGQVTINRPATIEAVKLMVEIYRTSLTPDVLNWDDLSNNRALTSGQSSLIINPVSAIRAAEGQDPALAAKIALAPALTATAGPEAKRSVGITGVNVIWKFSEHQDLARQFLVDLGAEQKESLVRSGFFNMPAYPQAVPDLDEIVARDDAADPPGKYTLFAHAEDWCTNLGYPGYANAAVDETFFQFVIPKMFANVARGEMTPQESVQAAEAEITSIFAKWRELGKI